ncbi:MAG: alpha-L-fucosidase [Ginsengibacter sp.]
MNKIIGCILLLFISLQTHAQKVDKVPYDSARMKWFEEAKLGIFIHWGIYAVNGIGESWSFYNKEISYKDYMAQSKGFTASKYNPEEWAKLFKEAGANYAVLTTKHHDGVALWNTKQSELNVVKQTPAKRDLVGPYCEALRKQGLKVGLYFSHLDWSQPDYASVTSPGEINTPTEKRNPFSYPPQGKDDTVRWNKFLNFHRSQLKELSLQYKPDLLWFDGDWERSAAQWRMWELRDSLLKWDPKVILNARMQGYGDYLTPEQGVPIVKPGGMWEFCVTTNDSWGYQPKDRNFKTPRQIINMFAETISMGGNLLLDIGPKADGTIEDEQVKILKELGRWNKKHAEAVYPTVAGLPFGHFYGPTTISNDSTVIYLFLIAQPWDNITLKGIRNKVKSIRVVGTGDTLAYYKNGGASWLNIPGVLYISKPTKYDENLTVVAVDLEGKLDLYHDAGGAVEKN